MLHTEKPETAQVDTTTRNSGNDLGASSSGDKEAGTQRPAINKQLLEKRYVQGDEKTWRDVVSRVANHAGRDSGRTEEFIDLISDGKFFPSRMTYMGTDYPFASSCFVFPVEDSLTGIMQTLSDACQVQKYGGGCIGGESIVLTDHGPMPIQELVQCRDPDIRVLSYDPDTHRTEYRRVGDWHTTALPGDRVYEISFDNMRGGVEARLRASDWHPFFVFDGERVIEVRADELEPGMAVIGPTSFAAHLDPWSWALGYITGDGAVSKNRLHKYARVRIYDSNQAGIRRAADVLGGSFERSQDERYETDVWVCQVYGDTAEQIRAEFTGEVNVLDTPEPTVAAGGAVSAATATATLAPDSAVTAYSKRVPQSVWQSDASGRFSYLVGYLDADGWFDKEKQRFEVSTVSERLAYDVVALAGTLGIRTKIRRKESRRPNEQESWVVVLERSASIAQAVCAISAKYSDRDIGWVCGSIHLSSAWRDRLREAGIDTYHADAWREATDVDGSDVSLAYWLQHGKATRETAHAILTACGEPELAHAVRSCQIVKEVKRTGQPEMLYDLTVPGTQTYVASDPSTGSFVVVHNTGYNFSHLRPKGDLISTSGGDASGPVSFMGLFHNAMEVVHRAGKKHAAQMGILNCDHPDIMEFIQCKDQEGAYWTFNISVAVTDEFMEAVRNDDDWELKFNGKVYKTIKAKDLWDYIVQHAWHNGDPGVIFIDTVNRNNRYPEPIEACNPCGEQMLPPYVSCNLGSIDLSRFAADGQIDWDGLEAATRSAIRFLDGSVASAFWPVDQIRERTRKYRNIGLGVMGWADMLILLGIPYDSDEAVALAEKVMGFIDDTADDESRQLGGGERKNTTVTSIAPTGSISLLAGCSSGIEPIFGIVMIKNTYVGSYHNVHWIFKKMAQERGFYDEEILDEIARTGSVQHIEAVPDDVKRLFRTAMEVDWQWHVKHQAAFQQHTDNAVSKTINLPNEASVADVEDAYLMAYETGCKSITVYRDGSRQVQVMDNKTRKRHMCPNCNAILFMKDGQPTCVTCGYKPSESETEAPTTEELGDKVLVKAARPPVLVGKTYRKNTPLGTAYVTINSNGMGEHDPFEVFLNVGKAGSEVSAVSEAMGRIMSLVLRIPSPVDRQKRLAWIADELVDIGGGRPMGFGSSRVRSLPDGVAQVLVRHLGQSPANESQNGQPAANPTPFAIGDICPDCGEAALLYEEGCRKCHFCGYSEC